MAMQSIGEVSLHNGGGFVVKISFDYVGSDGTRHRSQDSGDIPLGQTDSRDPGSLGVPDGSTIWLHADVVAGKDNIASQGFTYQQGNTAVAKYTITGTTLDNTMGLIEVG